MKTGIPTFSQAVKDRIAHVLRPVFECLGYARFSRPGLHQLDRRLESLMPKRNGWFVEAGANDGFQQSNTYYLARFKGWRGVLVEAVPHLAAACRKRRPESQVVACALGPPEKAGGTLQIRHAGLMSCICGALGDEAKEKERAAKGVRAAFLTSAGYGEDHDLFPMILHRDELPFAFTNAIFVDVNGNGAFDAPGPQGVIHAAPARPGAAPLPADAAGRRLFTRNMLEALRAGHRH